MAESAKNPSGASARDLDFHYFVVDQPWAWLLVHGLQLIHNADGALSPRLIDRWLAVVATGTLGARQKDDCLHPLVLHYLQKTVPRLFEMQSEQQLRIRADAHARTYLGKELLDAILGFFEAQCGRIVGCVSFARANVKELSAALDADCEFATSSDTHWLVGKTVAVSRRGQRLIKVGAPKQFAAVTDARITEALSDIIDSALGDGRLTVVSERKARNEERLELRRIYDETVLAVKAKKRAQLLQKGGAATAGAIIAAAADANGAPNKQVRRKKRTAVDAQLFDSDDDEEEEATAEAAAATMAANTDAAATAPFAAVAVDVASQDSAALAKEQLLRTVVSARAQLRRMAAERRTGAGNILASLTPAQTARMECYSRSALQRSSVKVAMQRCLAKSRARKGGSGSSSDSGGIRISDETAIVMGALCKSVVVELIEEARLVQMRQQSPETASGADFGAIKPAQLREALLNLQRDNDSFLSVIK